MTFQYYNNNGIEASTNVDLRLDNISTCEKGYAFFDLFEYTTKTKVKFINEKFSVISAKKIGNKHYVLAINNSGVWTYYTDGTNDNCSTINVSTKPLDYVIFSKTYDGNDNFKIDTVLRNLYICYSDTGQSVDCEKLRLKTLPRGYYFRKDAVTNEVERIFITGNPQDLILTENTTSAISGFNEIYNSEVIKSVRKNINDNKEVYLLIGILIILSATIYFIRKPK